MVFMVICWSLFSWWLAGLYGFSRFSGLRSEVGLFFLCGQEVCRCLVGLVVYGHMLVFYFLGG